jgi:hypothetical protein
MNIDDPCAALRLKPLSPERQDLIRSIMQTMEAMANQANIQGPPESLVNQWWAEWTNDPNKPKSLHQFIAKKTTQWHQENEKNN